MLTNIKLSLIFLISFIYLAILPCFGESNADVLNIERYLNSIHTLKAEIIQISSTGEVETGIIFIKKPGQMRFEYDPPSNHLVIASGLLLVIIDKKSNGEPQRYLTSQTPIGYLLNERVNLANNPALNGVSIKSDEIRIKLSDDKKPRSGQLELVFTKQPINLKEWIITSYSGEETRVLLEKIRVNEPLGKEKFNIGKEISNSKKSLLLP